MWEEPAGKRANFVSVKGAIACMEKREINVRQTRNSL
jgi:hypothetical protein